MYRIELLLCTKCAVANNSYCVLAIIILPIIVSAGAYKFAHFTVSSLKFPSEAPPRIIPVRVRSRAGLYTYSTAQATPRGMYCKYRNRLSSIASPIQTEHSLISMVGRSPPHFFRISLFLAAADKGDECQKVIEKLLHVLSYHESNAASSASIVKRREELIMSHSHDGGKLATWCFNNFRSLYDHRRVYTKMDCYFIQKLECISHQATPCGCGKPSAHTVIMDHTLAQCDVNLRYMHGKFNIQSWHQYVFESAQPVRLISINQIWWRASVAAAHVHDKKCSGVICERRMIYAPLRLHSLL